MSNPTQRTLAATPKNSEGFEKKLARYAFTGGAVLAASVAAQATPVYSGIQNITVHSSDSTPSYDLNLSGPASDDFTLFANTAGINVSGAPNAFILADPGALKFSPSNARPLDLGTTINGANAGSANLLKLNTGYVGAWPIDGTPKYLGLQFDMSGNPHFGWAQVGVNVNSTDSSFTVVDWAYENQASTAIAAGDSGAVPEPTSFALFAMGAAGLLAWRRRNQARRA
jgi:hypothetical protein